MSAVGAFPTQDNVLFLAPSPSVTLLAAHSSLHNQLERSGIPTAAYYMPDHWIPHWTIEMNIPDGLFAGAFNHLKESFDPLEGQLQEIGLTRFPSAHHLGRHLLLDSG